ncbi:hypothetical protein BJP34_31375 [Moorena producens PAL-8-15-08-1]|uniref:Uncharacterized protein n=1 Tax=Moorena producens PAL-8-15-08-1 TaxID=1458985 RepID=A0A1D8U0J3_9CYAN|nr:MULTISPECIES: hypothetical protein [Moorena]AOX03343.1 hypothetical protein BJP34_31375 [Moorena producens PAL-8-15-08-1]NEO79380.1 hypothetical protein [Moorena sp. SIO4G3]
MKLPVQFKPVSRGSLGKTYLGFKTGIKPSQQGTCYIGVDGNGNYENAEGNLTPETCCSRRSRNGHSNAWRSQNNIRVACPVTNDCGACLNQPGGTYRICRQNGSC